jgi:hypothetical protein
VFVSTNSDPVKIENGRPPEMSLLSTVVVNRTTADGRFSLPIPREPYVVGVVHEFGGAEIAAEDLKSRGEIVLQPWARVEGALVGPSGLQPDDTETIDLLDHVEGEPYSKGNEQNQQPTIDWSNSAEPDASRHFAFDRVLPGRKKTLTIAAGSRGLFSAAGEKNIAVWTTDWEPVVFDAIGGQTTHIELRPDDADDSDAVARYQRPHRCGRFASHRLARRCCRRSSVQE